MKDHNNKLLISVVTVSYNAVATIEETILSIVNQTYENIEYIIIDGGSTDGTVEIIKKYADKIAYWVSEPDKGIFDAMNKGLEHVTGDWVIFMNAGDAFCTTSVLSDIDFNMNTEKVGFIHGNYIGDYKHFQRKMRPRPFYENESFYKGMGFSHQSVFVRADLARKYRFDSKYKVAADYNQIYHIYKDGYAPMKVDVDICIMDLAGGFSINNRRHQHEEVASIEGIDGTWRFSVFLYYKMAVNHLKGVLLRMLKNK